MTTFDWSYLLKQKIRKAVRYYKRDLGSLDFVVFALLSFQDEFRYRFTYVDVEWLWEQGNDLGIFQDYYYKEMYITQRFCPEHAIMLSKAGRQKWMGDNILK